jgi:hypothetical protein
VRSPRSTSLPNNHNGSDIGSEDARQVPEMVQRNFFQQTSAFPGSIRTRQQGIREY